MRPRLSGSNLGGTPMGRRTTSPTLAAPGISTGTLLTAGVCPGAVPCDAAGRAVLAVPAMSRGQRLVHAALGAAWLAVLWRFWSWWLEGSHHGALGLYLSATIAFAYLTTFLPCFYWFYVGRMKRPLNVDAPPTMRVAMVTLCVPSHEELAVISRQLESLAEVRYPHDSWILDEGASPEVEALAQEHGVRYFTRSGIASYNQEGPPFQAKTKAGNVNAWLDHVARLGIEYDVFVQLDIDHRPRPDYLDRTLGYFGEPRVAWVQAPSVTEPGSSWTSRGLAEQDLVLQGPLQMGFYGHSRTPFIIGSHTTYRTAAIRAVGGFQPTRAEDHLDTVVLAAAGYSGVYLPEVIATGEGPGDLGTYMAQQFAWAYSMVQILIHHTPRLIMRYRPSQAVQFLVAQSWYALWSLSLAVLWVLPILSLLLDRPIANVVLSQFLAYQGAVVMTSTLMWWWTRRWFHPSGLALTWRGVLLEIARWPVVLWAVLNAVLRVERPYMVTRKGAPGSLPLPSGRRLYGPHLVLVGVAIATVAVFRFLMPDAYADGYLGLVLLNAGFVLALLMVSLSLELRDLRVRLGGLTLALRARAGTLSALAVSLATTASAVWLVWKPVAEAIR